MSARIWFKIGEVAEKIGVTPKELRYWEQVIPELRPRRSQGNLRYYHAEDLPRLENIRKWLSQGFTVSDCRDMLKGIALQPRMLDDETEISPEDTGLVGVLAQLRSLRDRLASPPVLAAGEASGAGQAPPKAALRRVAKKSKGKPKAKAETQLAPEKPKTEKLTESRGRMFAMLRLPKDWKG